MNRIVMTISIFLLLLVGLGISSASLQTENMNIVEDHQSTTGPTPPADIPAGIVRGVPANVLDYQVIIKNVPAYLWYNGCGPTASGMIIGYWDGQGFDDLVNGSAQEQTSSVNDMISSNGNYVDYVLPKDYSPPPLPDKSEPPFGDEHADDSIADFMKTSQSYHNNLYGWSWYSDAVNSLRGYVSKMTPQYKATAYNDVWGTFTWDTFRKEIDANHPVELLVDSDGDGKTDHFLTAIGYGTQAGKPMYASYNTWDKNIHWYEFSQMSAGQPFGIFGATIFYLEHQNLSTITITIPNGGESWKTGTKQTVKWSYTGNPGNVKVDLLKNGINMKNLTKSISIGTGGRGTYSWKISTSWPYGNDYQIRITSLSEPSIKDTSNNFTLIGPQTGINVKYPNGGETLKSGTTKTIKWKYTNINSKTKVNIDLYQNDTIVKTGIASGVSGGSYKWNIGKWSGNKFKIKITTSDNKYLDMSDGYFTIN